MVVLQLCKLIEEQTCNSNVCCLKQEKFNKIEG